ncbi:MAG TPA: alternative ribosome rescue aminoacyl-tRNA hydrolase ArfB [Gillisia sp.]|nr:alternative ribosome rescue aminoacyl-tRNA hydrolase ArfB [Gillisia sp.]
MPDLETIKQELTWKAVRSSGPGGQHVNKTASKAVIQFDIANSQALTKDEKMRILKKLESRLTTNSVLIIESSDSRSQHQNKEAGIERLLEIITNASKKPKPRKKTRPTKASKFKRLREKKLRGEKKENRQKPLL